MEILFRGLTEEQLEVSRDMARLLELRSRTDYQMIWSRAFGAFDRVELDDENDRA